VIWIGCFTVAGPPDSAARANGVYTTKIPRRNFSSPSFFSPTQAHANATLLTIARQRFKLPDVFCRMDLPMPRLSLTKRQVPAVCLALLFVLRTQPTISEDKIPAHLQSVLTRSLPTPFGDICPSSRRICWKDATLPREVWTLRLSTSPPSFDAWAWNLRAAMAIFRPHTGASPNRIHARSDSN
jgi:hypothetical protein